MSLRELTDHSLSASLFRYLAQYYRRLDQGLSRIYQNSRTCWLTSLVREKIKPCFRYSLFCRVTELRKTPSGILDNSRLIQYLLNRFRRWKEKGMRYLASSFLFEFSQDTKQGFYLSTIRTVSIITITVIIVNLILAFGLNKEIAEQGWLIRGLLFVFAIFGVFSRADWPGIKQGSIFLRKIGRNRENEM